MSKINEAHLGEYVPYQFQFPFNCILLCNPGSHAELMKIDDQTVVMGKQTTCWCLPQGGCPCPCCAWCGCGGFAFAPQFKIGLIEEHPDWYVGTSAIYKCGVCAGCPCMNSVNDVVKPLPDGKFGYYPNMEMKFGTAFDKKLAMKAASAPAPMGIMMKREVKPVPNSV